VLNGFLFRVHTTVRPDNWCLLCPIRVRYLIVAAFLAGHNPKESDNLKFVGEQAGKRKKQRAGSDKDVDLAAAGERHCYLRWVGSVSALHGGYFCRQQGRCERRLGGAGA
jgi:hypothetical protein